MESIDEVSIDETNGIFTLFLDTEKGEWNGKEIIDLTAKDKNSRNSHDAFLEKLFDLKEEAFHENNRKKNSEQKMLDWDFSFPNQEMPTFFLEINKGEEIILVGKFEGEMGIDFQWGGVKMSLNLVVILKVHILTKMVTILVEELNVIVKEGTR